LFVWYIFCSFGTFFSGFGFMTNEKSDNPAPAFLFFKKIFYPDSGLRDLPAVAVGGGVKLAPW
jgi:hypothetical protein